MTFKNAQANTENFMEEAIKESVVEGMKSPVTPPSHTVHEWGSTYSDFNIRSEDSSASWTDEAESDVTQQLREQFHKFEDALYGSKSYRGLTKSSLKESHLWSQHTPHLRVIGKAIRPKPLETDEVYDENYEELFESHGNIQTSKDDLVEEPDSLKEDNVQTLASKKDMFAEELKNEVLQKLFCHIWPRVFERVGPIVKQYFESKSRSKCETLSLTSEQSTSSESLTLSSGSYRQELPISKLPIRSKSSRSSFKVLAPGTQFVVDDYFPITNVNSLNHTLMKKPFRMTQTTVALPRPQPAAPPLMTRNRDAPKNRSTGTFSARPNQRSGKAFGNENRFQFVIQNPIETHNKPRNGLLPPIENLEITPKVENPRSTSALLRCTNIRNTSQLRLSSSRSKSGLLTPIETGNPELQVKSRRNLEPSKHLDAKLTYHVPICITMTEDKVKRKIKSTIPWK